MGDTELQSWANAAKVPLDLVRKSSNLGRLPVVTFAAGGIATPADAALMMKLGMDGVFVGSGIFKSSNPELRAKAIVEAVTFYNDPMKITRASFDLGEAMTGTCTSAAIN
jgi:pyridoxal 5'-phosphate synthase pdxS subunit